MIITLTPNPAVDQTEQLDLPEVGAVNRTRGTQLDPAGKGFLAGETGEVIERALRAERVQHHFVWVPGQTRVNLNIVDAAGSTTSFWGIRPAVGVRSPCVALRSAVGSGDSMVAGLVVALARGDDIVAGLRLGAAAGAATTASSGTTLARANEVSALLGDIVIEELPS